MADSLKDAQALKEDSKKTAEQDPEKVADETAEAKKEKAQKTKEEEDEAEKQRKITKRALMAKIEKKNEELLEQYLAEG